MMNSEFIVSLIGPDRVGIVGLVKENTQQHGGQWLSSKFMHMDGQFSALLRITVPADHEQALKDFFLSLPDLSVQFNPVDESFERQGTLVKVNVEASDKMGLINEISESLHSLDVFIVHMECNRLSVLASGNNLLVLDATLNVPTGIDADDIKEQLESLEQSVVVTQIN